MTGRQPSLRDLAVPSLLAWTVLVTTARAVRPPNDFALAHWLLDYRFGPIKRGFMGTLASLWSAAGGGEPSAAGLTIASYALLALSGGAMVFVMVRLARAGRGCDAALAALAAACSPWMVMHAHLTGYFDGLVAAMAVAAVLLARRGRVVAGGTVIAVAVLAHEIALVLALPVFLLAVRRAGGGLIRAAALPLAAFALLAVNQFLLPAGRMAPALTARLSAADFVGGGLDTLVPEWMTVSFLESLRQCADGVWQRSIWAVAPVLIAPAALVLLGVAWRRTAGWGDRLLVLAACALPQVVQLFAWDAPRFWTWSILTALLAAWVVVETGGAPEPTARSWPLRGLAVLAILAGIATTIPLMDGEFDHLPLSWRVVAYLPTLGGAALFLGGRRCRTRDIADRAV